MNNIFIWLVISIFYAYQYILRVLPNIILDEIINTFNIDEVIFGQFSGVYYLSYVIVHLPLGVMLDKYGPRKILSICIVICALSLLPLILATHPASLILSRIMLGVGSSAAILGIFKIIRLHFNEKYFTRMLSLAVTIGLLGAIYGGGPVSYLCEIFGYINVIKILIISGMVLSFITYLIIPNTVSVAEDNNIIQNIKKIITNYRVMFLACFAGFMVGPLEGFADVWGAEYLKQIYNLDSTTSSYISSLIFVGMCFGSPILSLVAEKTGYYLGTIIFAGIVMLAIFFMLLAKLLSLNAIIVCFIIVGICSSYQILAIYQASTYTSPNVSALTTAICNMIIMSFGYGFHTLIGLTINLYKNTGLHDAFTYGIGIIPLALMIGVVGLGVMASARRKNI